MIALVATAAAAAAAAPVVYASALQIKGVYTKNRIGITTDSEAASYRLPAIYSSRPPYDSGWFWTVEPDEENASLARTTVLCDSIISFSSTVSGSYLSTKQTQNQTEVVAAVTNQGSASQWTLKCENGPGWNQGETVMLVNLKHKCYLQTGFDTQLNDLPGKYAVTCGRISANALWKAAEGIYFPVRVDDLRAADQSPSTEL